MNLQHIRDYLQKDGWLLIILIMCVLFCLLLGKNEGVTNTQEERISHVLSQMAGAGKVEVAVYSEEAVPTGALIIADGASDVSVRLRITSAVAALLGLPPERIAVYSRQGGSSP